MSHDAKLELLIGVIAHAAHSSGLYKLPLIVCAMAQMRDAVRDPGLAKRAEESLSNLMVAAPESAKGLLRSMAWIARSVSIRSTTLAELAIPRLCAEAVKRAELDWQGSVLSETSKAVAA
ncbi:MAG: hypothetical protein ACYCV6_18810 [Steroidobacteraceae bacterium]